MNYLENYLKNSYILGICIGYHIFFQKSIENINTNCLNFIKENINLIANNCCYYTSNPNINWNNVNIIKYHKILKNLPLNFKQYFMHSYSSIFLNQHFSYATSIFNNIIFNSIIIKENKFLVQFHPEKSNKYGLLLLNNFLNL